MLTYEREEHRGEGAGGREGGRGGAAGKGKRDKMI
jgi:hypothetical protein